ncbi:efflux transporter outer membrane subunit [Piscinibacter sp. XHJ-5]|uniref:efflux transporter outer membrane subunit n=1 Tax=Piscinibacter sp. XHJ-5 TaxID=3037797 RepID=UPI00245350A9|nr:efflux transporter outer membrane subunit [Piscinibacter sp. XHJ-5]
MKPSLVYMRLLPLAAALALAACASPPAIDASKLPAPPAAFKEGDGHWTVAAPADAQARGEWWKAFGDPLLDQLMSRAIERNDRIHVAAARLAQAQALVRSADAQRQPQIGVSAGATRGAQPPAGAPQTQLSAGASLSYEVDLFGKLSRATDAAALDAESRQALLRSAQLLVQADVAQTYFTLRALDIEHRIVGDTVAAYRDTLRLIESRFRAGDVAELDVARVRTELAATESEALALQAQRAQLEHALAVLVGEVASSFSVAPAAWDAPLPIIPAGVPSTVLARRPDVAASQRQLLASQARVGVAQAAWFPDLQLTAAGGVASSELSNLFKGSARAWGIGALLSLPLFDGGRREAGIEAARAEMDGALATYREQVLVAFKDVEDQLSALRLLGEQAHAESTAVSSASRATTLSNSRYRNGLISQFELLDAQRSELRSRRQAARVRAAQYQATVGLIRALGGSWDRRAEAS